jgi:hypothetical protein
MAFKGNYAGNLLYRDFKVCVKITMAKTYRSNGVTRASWRFIRGDDLAVTKLNSNSA